MLGTLGHWLLIAVVVAFLFGLFAKIGRGK